MSRSTTRATVDLPEPLSPTSPSVSPARMPKSTPSTAWTRPVTRLSRPECTGKSLRRPLASSSRWSAATRPLPAAPAVTPGTAAGAWSPGPSTRPPRSISSCDRRQRTRPAPSRRSSGHRLRGARVERVRAPRVEPAPTGHLVGARHLTGDHVQLAALRGRLRHRVEQALGVGVAREREQRVDRRLLHDLARVHHDDAVADLRDDAEVMRDEQHGHPEVALQLAEQLEDLGLDRDVERGGGLVGDQQLRLVRQRHRDHRPLAHATRERVRVVAAPAPSRWGSPPGRASRPRAPTPPSCPPPDGSARPRRSGCRS